MNKSQQIDSLYKILGIYEDCGKTDKHVEEKDYLAYLDRLLVLWSGLESPEICTTIKGLITLGVGAEHKTVRRTVFHMISIARRG